MTDPCWYAVPGATGKEVAIFDLYPNTGETAVVLAGVTNSCLDSSRERGGEEHLPYHGDRCTCQGDV